MTEAVYTATAEYIVEMEQRPVKHHVSVSRVLKHLGVSRSGYNAWKKRVPSATEKHRGEIKQKIRKIYEDSHQNYGAPKITRELWKTGEKAHVFCKILLNIAYFMERRNQGGVLFLDTA